MPRYSVAEAKNTLPRLIDRAMEGEEVVITRHGKPVVEIRPTRLQSKPGVGTTEWLIARTMARPGVGMTSVEILKAMYEEDQD